jgi:hypothetical protein
MIKKRYIVLVILLLVGCSAQPRTDYNLGDLLLREDFEQTYGWDQGRRENVEISAVGGTYRILTDVNSYVRGFNSTRFTDVVIDVETVQLTQSRDSAYGVVCRGAADAGSGNGYYFLIGGDGSYSIRVGRVGEVDPLVAWGRTDAVHAGVGANNLRVVCVDDYLALYVNGTFVADVRDDTYNGGYVGFTAATSGEELTEVTFDNLYVYAAALDN